MATRQNIRPRPVDVNKHLTIVRDLGELDETEAIQELDAVIKTDGPILPPPPQPGQKKPKPKEIPVPVVLGVPDYTRDYLPTFHIPQTYLRGKGGTGWVTEDYVEYDMDEEDEDWLAVFNGRGSGCPALPDARFEKLLCKLELACSEATEKALAAACTPAAERNTPSTLSTTHHLPKDEAIAVLKKAVGGREQILSAVHDYWAAKRKRWGKPLMRRLQAPVVREKVNRPLTRRRRDNGIECLEKMRQVRDNLISALELAELLMLRERKKCAVNMVDLNVHRLQLTNHHLPPAERALAEKRATEGLKEILASTKEHMEEERLQSFVDIYDSNNGDPPDMESHLMRTLLRKRRQKERSLLVTAEEVNAEAISTLPMPPPAKGDLEYIFAMHPNPKLPQLQSVIQESSASLPIPYAKRQRCWRVGRGGRLMLTRVNPINMEPLVDSDEEEGRMRSWQHAHDPSPGMPVPEPWAMVLDTSLIPKDLEDRPVITNQIMGQRKRRLESLVETTTLGCDTIVQTTTPGCVAIVQVGAQNTLRSTGNILIAQAEERAAAIAAGLGTPSVGGSRHGRGAEGSGGPSLAQRKMSKSFSTVLPGSLANEQTPPLNASRAASFEMAEAADGSNGPASAKTTPPTKQATGDVASNGSKKGGGKSGGAPATTPSEAAGNASKRGAFGEGEGGAPSLPVPIPVDFE
eukprot:gene17801-24176_t